MKNYNLQLKIISVLSLAFAFFVLISISYFLVPHVFAQSPKSQKSKLVVPTSIPPAGINLSLSPTFLNVRTDPGKKISSEFKLRNGNTFPEYLKISISKFSSSSSGRPVIADIEKGDTFASWIETSEKEFVLNPGQTKTISFVINPPTDAALGYYYAIVISRILEEKGTDSSIITGSVALPVLLDVRSKNAKRELQIQEFKTDKLFYEYLPAEFTISFKNTGNVHVIPTGDIFIDSLFNKDIANLPVNEGRGNVLPGGNRTFTTSFNEGFATRVLKTKDGVPIKNDKGENEYEMKYDFSKANEFRFGRYSAHMLVVYDNGERDIPMEATVSFWIIPWKIVGGALIVLVLALIGLRSMVLPIWRKVRGK